MYEEKFMRFPQGKSKAFTLSYDDGVKADKKLLQIINSFGLKCTFNLNSELFDCENWHSRMDEEETFKTFSGCGQEIALHGARHVFLNKVPQPEAANEIVQNRLYLENKFKRIVRGLAYAYNGYNAEILQLLPKLGVAYARTTKSTHAFEIPQNFYEWNPTCHHGDEKLFELLDTFLAANPEGEFKNRESLLFYVWGHSYEFDDNDNWHILRDLAEKIAARKDVWLATNGEIYDYITAYKSLVFSLDGERVKNPTATDVFMELRGKTYRIGAGEEIVFDLN